MNEEEKLKLSAILSWIDSCAQGVLLELNDLYFNRDELDDSLIIRGNRIADLENLTEKFMEISFNLMELFEDCYGVKQPDLVIMMAKSQDVFLKSR